MNRKGVTLIEVIVAGGLGVVAFYGAVQMGVYFTNASASMQTKGNVDIDLDTLMTIISTNMAGRIPPTTTFPNPIFPAAAPTPFPVAGGFPAYCSGGSVVGTQCTNLTTYQTDVNQAGEPAVATTFVTSCVNAPAIFETTPHLYPGLCCPPNTLPAGYGYDTHRRLRFPPSGYWHGRLFSNQWYDQCRGSTPWHLPRGQQILSRRTKEPDIYLSTAARNSDRSECVGQSAAIALTKAYFIIAFIRPGVPGWSRPKKYPDLFLLRGRPDGSRKSPPRADYFVFSEGAPASCHLILSRNNITY